MSSQLIIGVDLFYNICLGFKAVVFCGNVIGAPFDSAIQ